MTMSTLFTGISELRTVSDAGTLNDAATVVERDPGSAGGNGSHGVEQRPVSYGIGAGEHGLGLAVWGGHGTGLILILVQRHAEEVHALDARIERLMRVALQGIVESHHFCC